MSNIEIGLYFIMGVSAFLIILLVFKLIKNLIEQKSKELI